MNHLDVLDFWFKELEPKQWWVKDTNLDETIRSRFHNLHTQAAVCELSDWRETAKGRLAEIIILDQFSRNLYRDTPSAFAYDALALGLAQEAIRTGDDQALEPIERSFLYMPFMHSESLTIHEQAIVLFTKNGIENNLDFEIKHKVIIERFGRYPHRNEILGRTSTKEEIEFLKQPDSSF
ncbi:DUF924 family protein [Vibrio mexicanus]|uniref:DUF924 family protein n=1 Tax=Vibrio mexicanus TaxID=1004326 RepID=UPI00063C145C|nr:DUF924 family protein [Vibrio mexicanus]